MTRGQLGRMIPDADEAAVRVEWSLRERGHFPTRDELIAIREVQRDARLHSIEGAGMR